MRIAVANLWPRPSHSVVDVKEVDRSPFEYLLYAPVPERADLPAVHSHLKQLPPAMRRAVGGLVLRASQPDAAAIRADTGLVERIRHRIDGKSVWLLDWSGTMHRMTPLPGRGDEVSIAGAAVGPLLKAIRRAEMSQLLDRPGVLLPAVSAFHYAGPNGTHYASFARPGLALRSVDALDSVCFWLRPHLIEPTTVLLDSWSMLSLGLKLKLDGGENVERVETLQQYDEPTDLILGRLAGRDGRLPKRILLLMSVSGTGGLADRLLSACHAAGCNDMPVVSLFAAETCAPRLKGDVFYPLGTEFKPIDPAECERCERSAVVKIEPTTYLMEITAAANEARITRSGATQAREFFDRYQGLDFVSVHRDQHDKARHHMVHIDVSPLLESRIFQRRLRQTVRPLQGAVDVIIAPRHPAAEALAARVVAMLGLPADHLIFADDTAIGGLSEGVKRVIRRSRGLVIADDVVITGDRFWSYRNALERAGLTAPHRKIHFLVGVERTPNPETLQGVKDAAHLTDFHCVEQLTLPHWGKDECPWCWELIQLQRLGEELTDQPLMAMRYQVLRQTSSGLRRNLFLHWGADGFRPSRLGPQSAVFGDLRQEVEVFAAVASVVQLLRGTGGLDEQFTPPAARILNPELTFIGRYYASVLTASILRCTRRHDLRSPTSDTRLAKGIGRRLLSPRVPELRSELLLAIARDLLPQIRGAADPAFLADAEAGVSKFLQLLLTGR